MYNINEIMVCLDNTPMDRDLIGYANVLASVLNPRFIYFVHVTEDEETSTDLFEEKLEKKINAHFSNDFARVVIKVLKGKPTEALIDLAREKDVEMMVIGKKKNSNSSASTSEMLTQKAPCSVAVIQEGADLKIENILLPVDFSSYSQMAVEEARVVTRNMPNAKLNSLLLYDVPAGYYKTGKNYNEAAAIMKKNKEEYYWEYMKKIKADDMSIEPHFEFKKKSKDAEVIYNFAIQNSSDLIIIGSRGKTKASMFLLGSTTGELLKLNDKIPLMVLKKKGEQFDLLNALRKI